MSSKQAKKSGFRISRKTAQLDFTGTEFDGAKVTIYTNISVRQVFEFEDAVKGIATNADALEVLSSFGDVLLADWNLQDEDDNPIPANSEGALQMPFGLLKLLLQKALQGLYGDTELPLEQPSRNGGTSEAATIARLANSSQSLPNSSEPS